MSIPMRIPEGKIILTYEDYVALPSDGNRYEILEGELAVTPAPSTKHQTASGNLFFLLTQHIKTNDLGKLFHAPVDLILESTSVLQPDLLFVAKDRQTIITDRAIEGAPDLVIEILSPTTSRSDRVTKAQIYARHKVPAYWIADPEEETVEVYLLNADSYRLIATLQGETLCPHRRSRISSLPPKRSSFEPTKGEQTNPQFSGDRLVQDLASITLKPPDTDRSAPLSSRFFSPSSELRL